MKMRLFAYLVLLPLFALIALTNISDYLTYIAYACIPVLIGLIIFAYIKTKAFYKMKKCLIFIILGLMFGLANLSPAMAQYTDFNDPQAAMGYYLRQEEQIRQERAVQRQSMAERRTEVRETIARLSRKKPRTTAEEEELQKALADYTRIQEALGEFPCPSSQQLYREAVEDCWACDIADLFIEAGDKVATTFYKMDKTAGYSTSLLIIGFMFWLIANVLKLLMSFGAGDIGSFFTELFIKLLLVGGIFILLLQPMHKVVDFAVSPFFLISSAMTKSIIEVSQPLMNSIENKIDDKMENEFGSSISCPYCDVLENNFNDFEGPTSKPKEAISNAIGYHASLEDRVVSPLMRNALLCTICTIHSATTPTTITGQFVACSAKKETTRIAGVIKTYANWGAVITGYTLTFVFFLISALFAFYLIDTFLRLAITLVLLPFLIVAFAFKSTQKYTVKGFEVLLHSVATYIMIALFLTIVMVVFYSILGPDASEIVSLTAANEVEKVVDLAGWSEDSAHGGRIFLCAIGILVITWFCLSKVDEYVTELTGVSLGNAGGMQATMSTIGAGMAVVGTVQSLYSQKWKKPGDESGENAESKAAKIREWGEKDSTDGKDGAAEQTTDQAADAAGKGIEKGGEAAAKACDKVGDSAIDGAKACYKIPYVGVIVGTIAMAVAVCIKAATTVASLAIRLGTKLTAAVTKFAIKHGARAVIKTAKRLNPAKMIARNKYFNKTVGAIWQTGENIKNTPRNIKRRYDSVKTKVQNAKAAFQRYKNRRRKRK